VRQRHIAFLVTRALLVVTGYLALTLFPAHPVESWQGLSFPGNNWIDGWVRWDSFWYESIVDPNPRFVPEYLSNANFFPFYSWVSWIVALPLRPFLDLEHAFFIGALIVSSASFVLALKAVERITTNIAGPDVATRTVWLIAVFPFSFFLTAVYADALYFCLCAWSLAFALERRWYLACALAAMAAMTRIPGIALFPALGLEYLRQQDWRLKITREAIVCVAILALAPIVIGSYYEWRYGNPLEFVHARQAGWNRASGIAGYVRDYNYFFEPPIFPCSGVTDCVREFAPTRALLGVTYLVLLPLTLALTIAAARTLGVALAAWTLISIAMSLPNGFDGVGRFTAVLFPIFIALAMRLRDRKVLAIVCVACVPFLLLFFAQFARWRQVL
jgi:Mannosyltransferase (PIG-V)